MTEDFEANYRIRWFDSDDEEAFLALHQAALSGGDADWFQWKYHDNPFTSQVPILVAESRSGAFAGARPQVPLRMRAGEETVLVLRFGDTMVHPDHRRRGVFSRLTRRALEHYRRNSPRLCFNCPNDLSRPGFLKVGGRLVTELPSYYRIQRPAAFAGNDRVGRVIGPVGRMAAGGYLAARQYGTRVPSDVRVVSHAELPVDLLASLYEQHVPSSLHVVRDEAFLDWRYGNPRWEYTTYSASIDDRPVAAVVTGRGRDGRASVATLVDVLPLERSASRDRAVRSLLAAVVSAYSDVDIVAYNGRTILHDVLSEFGFLHDGSLPLSTVASPSTLVAYDLSDDTDEAWSVGGLDVTDPDTWNLCFTELDAH